MKRILLAILLSLMLTSTSFAVGTATVGVQRVNVLGQTQRVILTISWVDDTAGTTQAIVPATYGIEGWYLYTVETNPGATAPTANYDIVLNDADGVDVAGGLLADRHTSTTQLVNIGTSSHGYPIIRSTITFVLSGNSQAGALGTCILTFVAN